MSDDEKQANSEDRNQQNDADVDEEATAEPAPRRNETDSFEENEARIAEMENHDGDDPGGGGGSTNDEPGEENGDVVENEVEIEVGNDTTVVPDEDAPGADQNTVEPDPNAESRKGSRQASKTSENNAGDKEDSVISKQKTEVIDNHSKASEEVEDQKTDQDEKDDVSLGKGAEEQTSQHTTPAFGDDRKPSSVKDTTEEEHVEEIEVEIAKNENEAEEKEKTTVSKHSSAPNEADSVEEIDQSVKGNSRSQSKQESIVDNENDSQQVSNSQNDRITSALDPGHEPFTHPVRPQPKQVLGEGNSQPNSRESQQRETNVSGTPQSDASRKTKPRVAKDHKFHDEEEDQLEASTKFLPNAEDWSEELIPESHVHDENRRDANRTRTEKRHTGHTSKLRSYPQPLAPSSTHQPYIATRVRPEQQQQQAFTTRQPFDEKLPPLNAQRQGLITRKYANYYFTSSEQRQQQNLPQLHTSKLTDSMDAIHSLQQNDRNKGLYLQTIRNAIKKLRYIRHYDSLESQQAVYMLVFSATRQLSLEIGNIMVEERAAEMLVNMLRKLTSSNIFMTDITWSVTSGILVIMSDYSHKHGRFAKELADSGAIPVLLHNLQHKPMANMLGTSKNVTDLIVLCIATLYSISSNPETDHHFDKVKVPKVLRTLYASPSNVLRLLGGMTLGNILFDHDPMRILEETQTVQFLVEALQEFARGVSRKRNREGNFTARSGADVDGDQVGTPNSQHESNIFLQENQSNQQGVNLDALELLRTLGRLAMHDNHKNELIKLGILELFAAFLVSQNSSEQAMAARALWSLVAGSNLGAAATALSELSSMDETVGYIKKLAERSSNPQVRFNCQALLWLLENRDYSGSNSASQRQQGTFLAFENFHK